MPNLLHTAHTSRHYSVPSTPNDSSSTATLVRRGGDGSMTGVFVIIACIVGGIGLVLVLVGWAHKSHKKENAKRMHSRGQRKGWDRPARRADAHHGDGGRTGRSHGMPAADGGYTTGGYGEEAGGSYEMQAPPSAYVRGTPSIRGGAASVRFPGPRYGYESRFGASTAGQYFERR